MQAQPNQVAQLSSLMSSGPSPWINFTNPNKDGYTEQFIGTVHNVQEAQDEEHPFYPDGNPRFSYRLVLIDQTGALKLTTVKKRSRAKIVENPNSLLAQLVLAAGDAKLAGLPGKTIMITTQAGVYSATAQRPWAVTVLQDGPFQPAQPIPQEYMVPQVFSNNAIHGGAMQQQPAPMQIPQPMPVQQVQPMMQPQMQQPMMAQAQPMPQPNISQQGNAVVYESPAYQQTQQQAAGPYDADIPF